MSFRFRGLVEQTTGGALLRHLFPLLKTTLLLGLPIDDYVASVVIAQMLSWRPRTEKDIFLYINHPGGYDTAGLAV